MQLTDYAENKIIDAIRGQGLTLPTNWYFALASAASDAGITELSGTGYARVALARSTANFNNTQADGTTAASSGTSHATGNTAAISWGTPGSAWGTANFIGIMDASTGGNCWFWIAISPIAITTGSPSPLQVAAGAIALIFGLTSGVGDAFANSLIDLLFRGVTYTFPATLYVALYKVAPSSADAGGTEVSGGSYARVAITPSLTSLSGTQSAGSTTASSGVAGRSSNNAAIVFPAPTANWGTVVAAALRDASTGGTLLYVIALGTPQTITSAGPAPTFDPNTLGISVS